MRIPIHTGAVARGANQRRLQSGTRGALSPAVGFETLAGMNYRTVLVAAFLLGAFVPSLYGAQIVNDFFVLEMDPLTGRVTSSPCCTTITLMSADATAHIEGGGQELILNYAIHVWLSAGSDALFDPPFLYYFDGFFSAFETMYFKVLGGEGRGVLRGQQLTWLEGIGIGEVNSAWGYRSDFAPLGPMNRSVPFAYEFTFDQVFRVDVGGYLDFYSSGFSSKNITFMDVTAVFVDIHSITDLEGRPMPSAYLVDVTDEVPEPSAGHLAIAGLAIVFITRFVRGCSA